MALALVASPAAASPPRKAGEVVIEARTATTAEGEKVDIEVGTIFVRENRAARGGRLIPVGFARIKSARPTGAPPIFMLPGGPGVTMLDTLDDPSPAAKARIKTWAKYSEIADLVVVEQRGHTLRGELLRVASPAVPLDRPVTVQADIDDTLAQARSAAAEHPGKDLAGYTVVQCAADVDELRRALGYAKITLFGASFGSQWSFAVMKLYPQSVARALLSAVEPLDHGYDMPSHVFAALQRIAFEADRDRGLAPYLPAGGLMAAVRAVRERLAGAPVQVSVPGEKPGEARVVALGLGDFQAALVAHAHDPATWPAFVLSLYHQRYDAWAREVLSQRAAGSTSLIGPLIDTSLGVTPAREHQLRSDPAVDWIGTWGFHAYLGSAQAWPTPDVGDALRTPTPSPIPVLLINGDWDASTPIENTLQILPYFPQGRAIVVHRGQHLGPFRLIQGPPEVVAAAHEFLRSGDMRGLPAELTLPALTFERPGFDPPGTRGAKR